MKRSFSFILLFILGISLHAQVVYHTNSGVNLRKGPSNRDKVLTTVPKNTRIEVLDDSNQWWYKVKHGKYTGYIAKDFVSVSYPKTSANYFLEYKEWIALIIAALVIVWYLRPEKKEKTKAKKRTKKARPKKTRPKKSVKKK